MPASRTSSLDPEDTAPDSPSPGEGYYKKLYLQQLSLQGSQSEQPSGRRKKKKGTGSSTMSLGRAIPKVASLFDDVQGILEQADYHDMRKNDPEGYADLKKDWDEDDIPVLQADHARAFASRDEIFRLVPNLLTKLKDDTPENITEFFRSLEKGASDARSDDISRLRAATAEWLNLGTPAPVPLLIGTSRTNRGIQHDLCGMLLCPIEYDWANPVVRESLRACEPGYDFTGSFFIRALYAGYKGNKDDLEEGFLKSTLLLKVFLFIFMTPTSANHLNIDVVVSEGGPGPTQGRKKIVRTSAAGLQTNKVTPRAIAYAAVQLLFALSDATSWNQADFDYHAFYNFVIDYFDEVEEGTMAKRRVQLLLKWWNSQVFPFTTARSEPTKTSSAHKLRLQRARRENE